MKDRANIEGRLKRYQEARTRKKKGASGIISDARLEEAIYTLKWVLNKD